MYYLSGFTLPSANFLQKCADFWSVNQIHYRAMWSNWMEFMCNGDARITFPPLRSQLSQHTAAEWFADVLLGQLTPKFRTRGWTMLDIDGSTILYSWLRVVNTHKTILFLCEVVMLIHWWSLASSSLRKLPPWGILLHIYFRKIINIFPLFARSSMIILAVPFEFALKVYKSNVTIHG